MPKQGGQSRDKWPRPKPKFVPGPVIWARRLVQRERGDRRCNHSVGKRAGHREWGKRPNRLPNARLGRMHLIPLGPKFMPGRSRSTKKGGRPTLEA